MGTANPLTSYCIRVASRREPPAPREFDGEERSGPNLAQPKADWGQTRPSLALSWGQLAPTWAQLGSNMAQLGHLWMQVGLSMCNLILHGGIWRRSGPKTSPMWDMASHEPPSKPKNLGHSGKTQVFSVPHWVHKNGSGWAGAHLAQTWAQVALSWARLEPKLAQIGHVEVKLGPKRSRWIPNWSHVMHMKVQVISSTAELGTFGDSFTPSWAQRRHNTGNIASDKTLSIAKNHLGAKLGRSWGQLIQVGPKLGHCWPKLTPSRANVAAMLDWSGPFGRCCADLQNVQITTLPCTFWRIARTNMGPSAVPDRSARADLIYQTRHIGQLTSKLKVYHQLVQHIECSDWLARFERTLVRWLDSMAQCFSFMNLYWWLN